MTNRLISGVFLCLAALATVSLGAGCDVRVGENGVSVDVTNGRANDEWKRTYALAKGGRLEIVSGGGPIRVTPSTGQMVEIRITREAHESTDEKARQALVEETITEEVAPDRVKVQTTRPDGRNTASFGRRRISTDFQVSIPAGLNVSIRGENADVSLENVGGQFTLENTNGGFRARRVSGSITATTVNGVIDFEIDQLGGDIKATTVNGPVRLVLPDNVNATVEARTVNGVVIVDPNLSITGGESERLHFSGRLGKGGPAITLNTTNGPVTISKKGNPTRVRGRRGGGEPVVIERQLEQR